MEEVKPDAYFYHDSKVDYSPEFKEYLRNSLMNARMELNHPPRLPFCCVSPSELTRLRRIEEWAKLAVRELEYYGDPEGDSHRQWCVCATEQLDAILEGGK